MRVVLLSFIATLLSSHCSIILGIEEDYSDAISTAIANLPKMTYSNLSKDGDDPVIQAQFIDMINGVIKRTGDDWTMYGKLSLDSQKEYIELMKDAGFFEFMSLLLNHDYMAMKFYASFLIHSMLIGGVDDEKIAEFNRLLVDVLFEKGIVTRLIELGLSEDENEIEPFYTGSKSEGAPLVNAKDEALEAVVNIVYYTRPGKLIHKLVDSGARDAVCLAARRSSETKIFLALESASRLGFQLQKDGLALKDVENIMKYVSLCNATENFCSHYKCVGDPNDRLDIDLDENTVEEDLSCEGVDKETCIERAYRNVAKAELIKDKDEQVKTFIVDEWYRIPGNMEKWKSNIILLGLSAANIRSAETGAPINGKQDPDSPLKLQKVFEMLGRDDCCEVSDDMLDQLYHRKDVVRYIVDTLYDHNPNFGVEMKEKHDERMHKEEELEEIKELKRSWPADIVDLYLEGSKPGPDGKDNSFLYAHFLTCLWAMADEPGSSLRISDVVDMLDDHDADELSNNFFDIMQFQRRDVVEYMLSTLYKDYGPLKFSEKMEALMNDVHNLPQITIIREAEDISDVCRELTVQLLEIKKKNFELFRFAVFNVLLPQSRSPDETFGIISKELSCRKWKDSCLHKLSERDDLMMMIMFDLIKRDAENQQPITTKERLKEELDQVLYGASAVTFDPRAVIQNVKYFICIILIVALILMYKSWQNQKRIEEEKKMREAEEARKKEKKAKRKKRQ